MCINIPLPHYISHQSSNVIIHINVSVNGKQMKVSSKWSEYYAACSVGDGPL